MSEEKKEQDSETEPAENKNHVGGFFDSLIADFSLDDLPASDSKKNTSDEEDDGEVVVETVEGITLESPDEQREAADTESVVLFDIDDPDSASEDAPDTEEPPAQEQEQKKVGFFRGLFPMKGDSVWEVIRKIIFLIAVIVFITAAVLLIINLVQSKQAVEDQKRDEEIIVTTVATTIDENGEVVTIPPTEEEILEHNFSVMEYYKNINPDVVGFMELEGCGIAQPVVQTDDNEYYLTHTYYNGVNQAGSIFMDHRCTVTEDYVSPSIVLYGHNQRDGTMFGNLKKYKYDIDFYTENPIITFNTEFESGQYVIFAYFVTNTLEKQDSNGEVFHYHDYIETLSDPLTFGWYMKQVRKRNQIISPVDVTYGDRLLVLSTCSNEYADSRFVVFARLLREGETADTFDFSKARLNENAKGIDWNAVLSVPTYATTTTVTTTESETSETTVPESEADEETTSKTRKEKTTAETAEEETTVSETEGTTVPSEETTAKTKKTTESETSETEETTTVSETSETTTTTPYHTTPPSHIVIAPPTTPPSSEQTTPAPTQTEGTSPAQTEPPAQTEAPAPGGEENGAGN
ncbi:MAG: sortase [Oscillospiraceae bacterium]|nr:sortase [Oscillospiraceae bacterium]